MEVIDIHTFALCNENDDWLIFFVRKKRNNYLFILHNEIFLAPRFLSTKEKMQANKNEFITVLTIELILKLVM